jgi:hypothetical protein
MFMCLFVCFYVCSLIAREWIHRLAPNLACLLFETTKITWEGQCSGKYVLSSILDEGGSSDSETKHDRRTAPRSKLFVSKRRLNKRRIQPRKSVLSSIPNEDCFVVRKLSTTEEWSQDKSCLFQRGDYRNKGHDTEKLSWVRFLTKTVPDVHFG